MITSAIRRRVFVVMPFGRKTVPAKVSNNASSASAQTQEELLTINFDEIYQKLLAPALDKAGCQPFRADQEEAAGDIRQDMFFELVTGDIVLADISILNANVFYELGVRHGVAPRGVLCVHAGWSDRPFDVAPDRTISYQGSLFDPDTPRDESWEARCTAEADRLAGALQKAIARDARTIGSPVYAHVEGLAPADVSNIRTQRAVYFNNIAENWSERIAIARKGGFPEDILTLAADVPTPLHRRKLVRECARALVELGRFVQAREILEEILSVDAGDFEARCQLALVDNRLGNRARAEKSLMRLTGERPGDPEAQGLLGRVYKDIWRTSWCSEPDSNSRRRGAVREATRAVRAIQSYCSALRQNAGSYFAGVNAVTIALLLDHAAEGAGHRRIATPVGDVRELVAVTKFSAGCRLEDPREAVWARATLGELALVENDAESALEFYEEATAEPSLTYFNARSMLEQVELFELLDFQPSAVEPVAALLRERCDSLQHPSSLFRRVIVASGHMIDRPDRQMPRFPQEKEDAVRAEIFRQFDSWQVGAGDLCLCGGARGADILFAEEGLRREASVWLLLPLPEAEFISASVRLPNERGRWVSRFRSLLEKCQSVAWQHERLGEPPDPGEVFLRNNLWMLNTARVQGDSGGRSLHALVVWDENPCGDGPGGTSDFVRLVEELGADVCVINPTRV